MSTIINAGRIAPLPKGLYDGSAQYVKLDIVTYSNESYICKQACKGIAPTNDNYWQLLAGAAGGGKSIVSVTKTATVGLVDTYTILYTDASTSTFTVTNGQDGEDGTDGRGIISITKTASHGLIDTYTITYSDRTTSTYQVTNGANGADGKGIVSITKTGTSGLIDTYTITYTDGTTSTYQVTNGEDGHDAQEDLMITATKMAGANTYYDLDYTWQELKARLNDDLGGGNMFVQLQLPNNDWIKLPFIVFDTDDMLHFGAEYRDPVSGVLAHYDLFYGDDGFAELTITPLQDKLVSGTSIKTINNTSILGSGDIAIPAGKSAYQSYVDTTTDAPVKTEAEWVASLKGADGVDLGEAVLVNNLTTGGATNVLSAEMGKVLMYGSQSSGGNVEYEFTQNGKKKGAAVGSTATETTDASFGYIEIPVSVGDIFVILAKGSSVGGGTYELTDSQHIVLSKSTTDFSNLPTMVTIANDGYIIINNQFTAIASPKVTKLGGYVGEFTLDSGAYISCASVGGTAVKSANGSWSCAYVPLLAGQRITIYTKGGNNGRAWAICDNVRKILSNAAANTDTTGTPVSLDIESNCFVAINNSGYASPKYVIEGGVAEQQPNLTDHEERIEALEAGVTHKALKILAIGNSFTGNAMAYMSDFLSNLDVANVTIYRVEIGGSSIADYWSRYQNDTAITPALVVGETIDNIGSTLKAALAHDWDFVVYQQVSAYSADYSTIEPNLYSLIAHTKALATNANCKVAWHMTWSWATQNTSSGPKGVTGFEGIAACVGQMLDYYHGAGIDVVIPAGSAIQNARGTSLNNTAELTTDYRHASAGVARYIICATWYESLIRSYSGISAMGSTMTISATPSSSDLGAESVTDSNRNLCLMCVEYAVANPYNISTIVE